MKNTNEAEKNIGKTLLIRLNSLDKGERSVLRRTVGRSLSQIDVRALETAFRVMPDDRQTELRQSAWLLALGVGSLWDAGIVHKTMGFADMLRLYKNNQNMNGMDHLFRGLLDTRFDGEDGYLAGKIGRLARMLWANDQTVMPDVNQLLYDIDSWNDEKRTIQIRWAQRYYQKSTQY